MRRARKVAAKTFCLFCVLSPCHLSFSLSLPVFLDLCSKRRVAEMSLWAGLPGPPLKAALAKKRGGKKEDRGERSEGETGVHPSIGIKRVTSPWGEIESERAMRRDVTRGVLPRSGPKNGSET